MSRLEFTDWLMIFVVLVIAALTRVGYVSCCNQNSAPQGLVLVQDPSTDYLDRLVENLRESGRFFSIYPYKRSDQFNIPTSDEPTAYIAPGYPWYRALLGSKGDVWSASQIVLGSLTPVCFLLFARLAFRSRLVALLTGLLCAIHPFWILATPGGDAVLAAFLLGLVLWFGTWGAEQGGAMPSLLFGFTLAALSLTRAAMLVFAFVALTWFLYRCRTIERGWLCSLLAFLGFVNGVVPWVYRNYQQFHEITPIVDSTYIHLRIGNNPMTTGGDAPVIDGHQLSPDDNDWILANTVGRQAENQLDAIVPRRILAVECFLIGEKWRAKAHWIVENQEQLPPWLVKLCSAVLPASLFAVIALAFLGWRWSYAWRRSSRLLVIAMVCIPIPYILSHAESLHGPRMPFDGVLLTFAAFGLARLIPGQGSSLRNGPEPGDAK